MCASRVGDHRGLRRRHHRSCRTRLGFAPAAVTSGDDRRAGQHTDMGRRRDMDVLCRQRGASLGLGRSASCDWYVYLVPSGRRYGVTGSLRTSMAFLHTWAGLLAGWLLFAIFLTGTATYYHDEITRWMQPEIRAAAVDPVVAAERAIARLRVLAPGAQEWLLDLPSPRNPLTRIFFRSHSKNGPAFGSETLDPNTGQPVQVRETRGGDSLYYFHFDLLMPSLWGRLIVGFAAVIMLLAIISGIITHRRFFRDFFTFRPGRGQRSWLDAHNLLGVTALPYHILITYTGIVTLLFLYMPWGVEVVYNGDHTAFQQALGMQPQVPMASSRAAPLINIARVIEKSSALWDGGNVGRLAIYSPDNANARIAAYRSGSETIAHHAQWALFNGATGDVLHNDGHSTVAARTQATLYGLHEARFAGPLLRVLLFFSGLAGTAMVATGLIYWLTKRRTQLPDPGRPPLGFRMVQKLNLATIIGLPIGIAAHFWANRLLPVGMGSRADWEVRCLFLTWVLMFAHACIRPVGRAWQEQLCIAAGAFALLPLLNALTTERALWHSLPAGDWVFAGFDLATLIIGVMFAFIARTVAGR